MRSNLLAWVALAFVAAGTLSCRKSAEKDAVVSSAFPATAVATIGGQEISEETLRSELRRRFGATPAEAVTLEQKLETLERLVRQEAIFAQAKASGFDQSPEMQARIKNLIIAQFREQRFTNATSVVSEQEIQTAYEASGDRFVQPASMRGAMLFIAQPANASAEKKAEARRRAESILAEARAGDAQAFAQLCVRHSDDQVTRYKGGDLGWFSRGAAAVEPALVDALEKVSKAGDFAPLIETSRGYFIARLVEIRDAARKPLAEVKELLRHQSARDKAALAERDFHAAMKHGLEIRIDQARVEQLSIPTQKSQPPRLPGVTMSDTP
ncbi:MAG: peptidyl-prolyl cis-trans isomerase [Verrucomicrobia bacterium]|nr:peptidyl-prolyl cis-trans isomerase [Verrucomicrobiota bacterium]